MSTERDLIKRHLDDELESIVFTGHERVTRQTHPPTLGARLFALWNKEIEIPVKPIGALGVIILVTSLALHPPQLGVTSNSSTEQVENRELIVAGGNTYWKDIYEKAVQQHEN
jgi:hypothetical protein